MSGTTKKSPVVKKMDPVAEMIAYRAHIKKEEAIYGGNRESSSIPARKPPAGRMVILGALGAAEVYGSGKQDGRSKWGLASLPVDDGAYVAPMRPPSAIESLRAGSTASYPRTPDFSGGGAGPAAQSKAAVGEEIMGRLAALERELKEERKLLEVVEREMVGLLSRGNTSG